MKYGLGLILSLNAQNFRAGTRRAAADLKQFGLAGERAFNRLNRAQNQVAANTTKLMAAFSGLYVGVAAIQALTKATKEYDYQLRSLAAIQRGSLKEATKFIEVLYKGNRNLREFSKATVAGAARQLVQAGYSMGQASEGAKLLETSLNAVVASMGALNADQAIQLGINLEKGFGRGQRAATELMDVVSQSINMFPLTMDKVQVALGYATSAAQTYNQDLESTMIAIGALMPVVATASKAGVAYRNTLAGLTKPFTSEQLSERGIRLRDSRGEMRDAMEILFDLDRSLDEDRAKDKAAGTAETETLIHRMFGIRGKALFTAISQLPYTAQNVGALKGIEGIAGMDPRDVYHLLRAATANASGETQRLADAMREAAKIVDQRFAASMENFSENLGAAFLPLEMAFKESIMGITDGLTSLGIGLKDFFTAIGFTKDGLSAMTRTVMYLTTLLAIKFAASLTKSLGVMAFTGFMGGGMPTAVGPMNKNLRAVGGIGSRIGYGALGLLGLGTFYDHNPGKSGLGQMENKGRVSRSGSHFLMKGAGMGLMGGLAALMGPIMVIVGLLTAIKAYNDHQRMLLERSVALQMEDYNRREAKRREALDKPNQAIDFIARSMGIGRALDDGDLAQAVRNRTIDFIQGFQKRITGQAGYEKFKGDPSKSFDAAVEEYIGIMGLTGPAAAEQRKKYAAGKDRFMNKILTDRARTSGGRRNQRSLRDQYLGGTFDIIQGRLQRATGEGAGDQRRQAAFFPADPTSGQYDPTKVGQKRMFPLPAPLINLKDEPLELAKHFQAIQRLRDQFRLGKITPEEYITGSRKQAESLEAKFDDDLFNSILGAADADTPLGQLAKKLRTEFGVAEGDDIEVDEFIRRTIGQRALQPLLDTSPETGPTDAQVEASAGFSERAFQFMSQFSAGRDQLYQQSRERHAFQFPKQFVRPGASVADLSEGAGTFDLLSAAGFGLPAAYVEESIETSRKVTEGLNRVHDAIIQSGKDKEGKFRLTASDAVLQVQVQNFNEMPTPVPSVNGEAGSEPLMSTPEGQ